MPVVTRADVEAELVSRCGAYLTLVGKATTSAGSNADLNGPIGAAIRSLGLTVASFGAVADADLATVQSAQVNRLLDQAELRTLEDCRGNWTGVDEKYGQDEQRLGQLAAQLDARIKMLEERVRRPYGSALGRTRSGLMGPTTVPNNPDDYTSGRWSVP